MEKRFQTSESEPNIVTISKAEYDRLNAQISELNQQVQWLTEQFQLAKHRQFGASSEKSSPGQLNLFNEAEVNADESVAEPELHEVVKQHTRKKAKRGIDRLPEDIPVEVIEHTLPEEEQICPECGNDLHVIGKDIREELKIIPAQAVIVQHVTYTYACRDCEKNNTCVPIVKAVAPQPVIKGSFSSPQAIAHIAIQKFVMGVPLYRQAQEWERAGVNLSRQTMSNWLIRVSVDWLTPLYERLHCLLLERNILHADETTLQVLHEEGKTPQSKSSMWLYRTGWDAEMPIVLYDYQPDRRAKRPQEFLVDFKGYLHTDGYEGYHGLPENIVVVGCWSHVRRKFKDALKVIPEQQRIGTGALQGKYYCDKLFSIERGLTNLRQEERLERRCELAQPVLDEMYAWLNRQDVGKTTFGTAVRYTLGQWKYLKRYLLDGWLEISNNRAERSIKPFVIGRKNWLFSNTPKGAKGSAILYSIVETAKENGLDPYRYLAHILMVAPNCDMSDPQVIESLLPNNAPADCRCKPGKTEMPTQEDSD